MESVELGELFRRDIYGREHYYIDLVFKCAYCGKRTSLRVKPICCSCRGQYGEESIHRIQDKILYDNDYKKALEFLIKNNLLKYYKEV
ncbi:MAG: hypothetical protein ACP5PT_06835 [Brevinematia bacterium]